MVNGLTLYSTFQCLNNALKCITTASYLRIPNCTPTIDSSGSSHLHTWLRMHLPPKAFIFKTVILVAI